MPESGSLHSSRPQTHPALLDAYRRGFQDGVLSTLDELAKAHDNELPGDIAYWATTVREKVEADRG